MRQMKSTSPSRWNVVTLSVLTVSLLLLANCAIVASAASASSSSSTVFVSSTGVVLSSPLELEGTDVGAALRALHDDVTALTQKVAALESELEQTNAVVAEQGETIASLTAQLSSVNSTVSDISDLEGETTIVVVVNDLRRRTHQLTTDVAVIDGTVANHTTEIRAITKRLTNVESLTSDSTIVSTVISLKASTADLQNRTAVDEAAIAALQSRATSDELLFAGLQSRATADELAVSVLQNRTTADEVAITVLQTITNVLSVNLTAANVAITLLQTVTAKHTTEIQSDESAITALQALSASGNITDTGAAAVEYDLSSANVTGAVLNARIAGVYVDSTFVAGAWIFAFGY